MSTKDADLIGGTRVPNTVVIICATVVTITLIGCITVLSVYSRSTDDLFRFLNTILNGAGVLSGLGAFLYAGAAAKSSQVAAQQTNGSLDERIQTAVHKALDQRKDTDNG